MGGGGGGGGGWRGGGVGLSHVMAQNDDYRRDSNKPTDNRRGTFLHIKNNPDGVRGTECSLILLTRVSHDGRVVEFRIEHSDVHGADGGVVAGSTGLGLTTLVALLTYIF